MLVGNTETWWHTLLEVCCGDELHKWEEFKDQFKEAYNPPIAREGKRRVFEPI